MMQCIFVIVICFFAYQYEIGTVLNISETRCTLKGGEQTIEILKREVDFFRTQKYIEKTIYSFILSFKGERDYDNIA